MVVEGRWWESEVRWWSVSQLASFLFLGAQQRRRCSVRPGKYTPTPALQYSELKLL